MTLIHRAFVLGKPCSPVLKNVAKRAYYYSTWWNRERHFVCINSIPKSGTNYCKAFLANYLNLHYGVTTGRTSHGDMRKMFPNFRVTYIQGGPYIAPAAVLSHTQYRDIVHGHSTQLLQFFAGRLIFLYRNPLDVIVSRYFYSYKNRPEKADVVEHPRDIIDTILDEYIAHFHFMRDFGRRRANSLRLCYEDILEFPETTFQTLLNWLNIPVTQAHLRASLEFSSFQASRQEEVASGPIHATDTFRGFFTRSGSIGQWQEYFNADDMRRIQARLGKDGIDLGGFVTLPRRTSANTSVTARSNAGP